MNFFGLEIRRKAQAVPVTSSLGNMFGFLRESFSGAWQKGITLESQRNVLAFSAVFSCVRLISSDIGKLEICLVEEKDGVCLPVARNSPFLPVLTKPNPYQTRIQFMEQWIISKLLHGNAFILKGRDGKRIVNALYPLSPQHVTPLVADDGSVWYRIARDNLSGVAEEGMTVPASEIIHDRGPCLFHPLVGVSPIFACAASATQGIRIQANSERFFANMSAPSGQLTAPGTIQDVTAERLKTSFESKFSGANIGHLFVAGDGLKYEPITIPAQDAQLIEQLRWTVEDVARCFNVPLHKLGAQSNVTYSNVAQLNQDYYSQCLQTLIEAIEVLLENGLGLNASGTTDYEIEMDLDGLLRMDGAATAERIKTLVGCGVMTPNEGRAGVGLPPVAGGETPYLQVQNYSLAALKKRDDKSDFIGPNLLPLDTPPPALPAPDANSGAKVIDIGSTRRKYARTLRKAA